MTPCIFCKIAAGEIASRQVYRDDAIVAFHDVNPQAPVHILVIPHKHVASLADLTEADTELAGRLQLVATQVAAEAGLAGSGYRVVVNCGADACQSVPHLHLHVMGGRQFSWPPG